MKNKGIIFFIAIILFIIAGFLLFNSFLKENVIEEVQEELITGGEATLPLIVPEQAGGSEIFIESAVLPNAGYVVIHREKDGKLGEIIGVSEFLSAGIKGNFLMSIDEEVVEGDTLFAMIHTDDGDGIFDGSLDVPLVEDKGDIVLVKFVIVNEGALEDEFKL